MIDTFAKALPEKTFFRTTKPLAVSGRATAPETRPALQPGSDAGRYRLTVHVVGENQDGGAGGGCCVGNDPGKNLGIEMVQGFLCGLMDFFYPIAAERAKVTVDRSQQNAFCCYPQLTGKGGAIAQCFQRGFFTCPSE